MLMKGGKKHTHEVNGKCGLAGSMWEQDLEAAGRMEINNEVMKGKHVSHIRWLTIFSSYRRVPGCTHHVCSDFS